MHFYSANFILEGIEIKSDGLENQIRQQSEQYFEIYDFIAKYVTYAQRVAILNRNSVTVSANAQSTRVRLNIRYKKKFHHKFQIIANHKISSCCQLDYPPVGRYDLFWCFGKLPKMQKRGIGFQQLDLQMFKC